MRHRYAKKKLGRTTSHRIAMERNMASSLIEHERIVTTLPKAKHIPPIVEKLVTLAKEPKLHNRRLAFARLRDNDAVFKLFDVLGPRFKDRPGGYCRILKLAKPRLGDAGDRAIIEFVERTPEEDAEADEQTVSTREPGPAATRSVAAGPFSLGPGTRPSHVPGPAPGPVAPPIGDPPPV